MQAKTKGIIINQVKYSDSSVIVSIYTKEFGRMSYMVRGINKKKSACRAALLQPLSVVEMDVSHNPKQNIQHIKDLRIAMPFYEIPFVPVKNTLALFMAEVLHKTLRHSEFDEILYNFLENSISELDICQNGLGNFHLVFLARLSRCLGFAPNMENAENMKYFDLQNGIFENEKPEHLYVLEEDDTQTFRKLMLLDYRTLNQLSMKKTKRAEMLNSFVTYYKLHLADFHSLYSIDILHKIWE